MNDPLPNERPEAMTRIYETVSDLIVPQLEPLAQVFVNARASVNEKRVSLLAEMEEVRMEAYEAATRLTLPFDDALKDAEPSYFELIQNKSGVNHHDK